MGFNATKPSYLTSFFQYIKIKRVKEKKRDSKMSIIHWDFADPATSQHARTESKIYYKAV